MDISYIINILGEERHNYYNAVSPPIIQSSNFSFTTVEDFRQALHNENYYHVYSRGNNPTVEILRKKMAALEGAEDALIFSSGVAAIAASIMNSVKSGDHVICVESSYSWTEHLLKNILPAYGVTTTFIDGTQISNFENALRHNTKLIYLESPNTFRFDIQDLGSIARLAKEKNIVTIIDNSYCTPLFQQPHALGIDLIVHTATKYLSGHSDVIAGVVCGNKKNIEHIFKNEFLTFGATISPNDAWLIIRGLRTLPMRLEKSAATAEVLIAHLEQHPAIEKIIYPYHVTHPQFKLAKKQMKRGSGLFGVILKTTDLNKIEAFCNQLQRFLMAVSWGGYESLIFPACVKEHNVLPQNFIRLYVGLEEPQILIEDLDNALKHIC